MSAKKAGSRFERGMADYLAGCIDDRIDRRVKTGAKDRGDLAGLRVHGLRVVGECKDTSVAKLGPWVREAELERVHDDALAGVVFHKRRGFALAADQFVTMTVADFVALVTGVRPDAA